MKWLALLFGLFILLVILMVDAGILAQFVGFLYLYPFGDKVGHFMLYGILAFLLNLALFQAAPSQSRRGLAMKCGLVLGLLIGVEEFSQQYFANRTFDLVDLLLSYLGVIFFSWLALKLKNRTS